MILIKLRQLLKLHIHIFPKNYKNCISSFKIMFMGKISTTHKFPKIFYLLVFHFRNRFYFLEQF